MDKQSLNVLFGQPPRRAIEYLEQKQVMPSQDWWQVQGNAHNKAFVIAQMTRLDLLEDIRKTLVDAQKNGLNLKQWSEIVEPKMRSKGWWGRQDILTEDGQRTVQLGSPYRLKTIYQTNIAQAYEAGRQAIMWDDNPLYPYVMYSAILDNKTRPRHRALHGIVMLKTDPAWEAIAPKNGYNCRCTVLELMNDDVHAYGYKVRSSEGYFRVETVDVSHGGTAQVARLEFPDLPAFATDAGWVGRPNASLTKQLLDKATIADTKIASNVVQQAFKNEAIVNQYNNEIKQWMHSIDPKRPNNEMRSVGVLDKDFLDMLAQENISIESAAIIIHDKYTLGHLDKDRKRYDREWFENIVLHLTEPHDLYIDVNERSPLLVFDMGFDESYKLVLVMNKSLNSKDQTGTKQKMVGNMIRTIVIEKTVNLTNGAQYKLLAKKK